MKSFKEFAKHPALSKKEKMDALHGYRNHLLAKKGQTGSGKRHATPSAVIADIKQHGGRFKSMKGGSFWGWIKGAANTVYNKAIKPAANYVKNKPLSTLGKVAGVASFIPSPFSGALKGVSAAANAAGAALGKGIGRKQKGGAIKVTNNASGKVILAGL